MGLLRLKKTVAGIWMVVGLLLVSGVELQAVSRQGVAARFLARIDMPEKLKDLGLPVYAQLQGADGKAYVLTLATVPELRQAGVKYTLLHDARQKAAQANYLMAMAKNAGARQQADRITAVLQDDGRQIIVCATADQANALAGLGFEIEWLSSAPLVIKPTPRPEALRLKAAAIAYQAQVAEMIGKVATDKLLHYIGDLCGDNSVNVSGSPCIITARNTNQAAGILNATQYAFEFMQNQGLAVQYHTWSAQAGARNIIATKTGGHIPAEIVLLTAHLDDMPAAGLAPGADDNASGSAGVMLAAEIMKDYQFKRTIRFALFTGEEQGLLGSTAYADQVSAAGENIVAVLNLDMIAWNAVADPVLELHTRHAVNPGYAGDKALADLFVEVVDSYGLSGTLTPRLVADGITYSDHSPFWNKGYSAMLAIEDYSGDFCAYYHTADDKPSTLNQAYYTGYVKAAIGAAAHLAQPLAVTPSPTMTLTMTPAATNTAQESVLNTVYPNPFNLHKGQKLFLPKPAGNAAARIYNGSGELICEISSDSRVLAWDGRDNQGRPIAPGVYFYMIQDHQGNRQTGKFAIVR